MRRYIRNIGAITEGEMAMLRGKSVFVAGCGGLGGYVIDMLLRLGVGSITAADGDTFEESNLNRQLLSDVSNMGMSKVMAAKEYGARVNPDVELIPIDEYITEENAKRAMAGCHIAVDALDNAQSRLLLSRACGELGIPLVHGAVSGFLAQWGVSLPGDGLMESLYAADTPKGEASVLPFTAAYCAAREVSACMRLLLGQTIETGRLYIADLSEDI